MDIFEVILDETNLHGGVNAISLVRSPAVEIDFVALSEQKKVEQNIKLADEDKRILMGAALVPNKPIYRNMDGDEFYIMFSKETIARASQIYFKRNRQNNSTLEHQEGLTGLTTVESWIVEDVNMDKSKKYNFNVPIGTWMVSMKVDNDDVWQKVKSGDVKGFSIEGYFVPELRENLSIQENQIDEYASKVNEVKKLLGMI